MRTAWLPLLWFVFPVAGALAQVPASTAAALQQTAPPAKAAVHFVARESWIPVQNAFPRGLDTLEVYADLPGRHPLAVLTHGTSDKEEERSQVTPWAQFAQALWFARRGYVAVVVVRKGYGRSGGQRDGYYSACGSRGGSFQDVGESSADDLRGVVKYAGTLAEVDTNTVVSAGVSTGGFAQVALSANPPSGLKAAISFAGGRGGDGHEHNCNLSLLVSAFGSFGKKAQKHGATPMLWIYAQNDHWFPPAMAQQFDAAYTKGGGVDQFVLAPPDGEDGHHLYAHVAAWSATVDGFLKAHHLLPLGDEVLPGPEPPNIPAPAGLHDEGLKAWRHFLLGGPAKAFAIDPQSHWGDAQGMFDQGLADALALERCRKAAGGSGACSIVARTPAAK